jgi:MFS family permease
MFGLAIGPVFGGVISQLFGFHAIFWFLFGLGAINLVLIVLLLPETLRSIAGNGTILLISYYKPLIYKFSPPADELIDRDPSTKKKISIAIIFVPLKLLLEKDVFMFILYGAWQYTVWSMVTSSTSSLFQNRFHLTDLQVGLIFLPNGAGSVLGSILTGKIMVRDFTIMERRYRTAHNIPDNVVLNKKELIDFPFEKARLRNIWWMVLLFITTTSLYGFSIRLNILAIPLILQFFISYTANSVFALNQTLVVDLYPRASASATAVNNLMRCLMGAGGVAVVQIIIDKIGAGLTFLLFAEITVLMSPLLVVEWKYGERWRRERKERLDAQEQQARDVNVDDAKKS